MWDRALMFRLVQMKLAPLYGIACDDVHHYQQYGLGTCNPGRGWVVVRSARLTADDIVRSMRDGQFYASSGVILSDLKLIPGAYKVTVQPSPGVRFRIQFIGAHRGHAPQVFSESKGLEAVYHFRGDEVYVRADVISSRLHSNPSEAGLGAAGHPTAAVH